jgi:predicted RNA-binding Zn ribbon-like protein
VTRSDAQLLDALPPDELQFRFMSGRPCLDLTATVGERWRRNFERLRTPRDVGRWVREAGLLTVPASASQGDLEAFRDLRDVIYRSTRAVMAGQSIRPADERALTKYASAAPLRPVLNKGRAAWRAEEGAAAVLSTLARDAIDLLTGPLRDRVRECASGECALLFVDASRPGQRRWCSSETCGGRARASTYRSRHRPNP